MVKDIRTLCKDIGDYFGDYFEEDNQLCIDNGEKIFRYNTEKELLLDWVDTIVSHHHSCGGKDGSNWDAEVAFIYENVIGKRPSGVRIYSGKKGIRYVAEGYVPDNTSHGRMIYLGTYDSIVHAICAVWKHKEKMRSTGAADYYFYKSIV